MPTATEPQLHIFHLPGKHNQKDHAGKGAVGPRGRTPAEWDAATGKAASGKTAERSARYRAHSHDEDEAVREDTRFVDDLDVPVEITYPEDIARSDKTVAALAATAPASVDPALWVSESSLAAAAAAQPTQVTGPTLDELDEAADVMAALVAKYVGRVAGYAARHLGGVTTTASGLWVFEAPGQPRDRHGRWTDGGGGGPGIGTDLLADGRGREIAEGALASAEANSYGFDRERFEPLAGRMLYRGGGVGPHGDEALHAIAERQGFTGLAMEASREQMDAGIKSGDTEMFRGVRPSRDGSKSASDIHEQVRSGEAHYGLGFSGNGYYMSSSRSEASAYGQVGRYALHRDARIVDYRELQSEQARYIASVGRDSVEGRVFSDPGRYAAARGYDAIHWRRGEEVGKAAGAEDEFMVLNRTALIAEV